MGLGVPVMAAHTWIERNVDKVPGVYAAHTHTREMPEMHDNAMRSSHNHSTGIGTVIELKATAYSGDAFRKFILRLRWCVCVCDTESGAN